MSSFYDELIGRFRKQLAFAETYSPLYAAFFGTLADWLQNAPASDLTTWLLAAGNGRSPFDVPLLLAAGLHRDVLLREPAASELARFYPSAGGTVRAAADEHGTQPLPAFQSALRTAILTRRAPLAAFIQSATVQTNETGRGIAWLLPLLLSGWEAAHLVDLGASAGLNLVAERRAFRLAFSGGSLDVGQGEPVQFEVDLAGQTARPAVDGRSLPQILSRTGCDLNPFRLETAVDEQTLAAFVWPDQVARLQRLREGIAAFRAAQHSDVPVRLHAVELPVGLPEFLETAVPRDDAPVLLYNTYITMYLPSRGVRLREHIGAWAATQRRPVLWIQWEPPKNLGHVAAELPEIGWLAWTADLWHAGTHRHRLLGWTHPHGQRMAQLDLRPGLF